MSGLLKSLLRTVILDDAAYQEWREPPNLFLRGIVLIVVITLVATLVSFGVNLVNGVRPVNLVNMEQNIRNAFEQQFRFNPAYQDPELRRVMEQVLSVVIPMSKDLAQVPSPLPRGFAGFFQALGGWLSRPLTAVGGWLFYGALVLIAVNLLGGSAKLPNFLGMVSLYVIPSLLRLLQPVPCVGWLLALIGVIWSIVIYVKAVSVATDLDAGRAVLAVIAPAVVIVLLGLLVAILATIWLILLF
jgi:hypothetical protein